MFNDNHMFLSFATNKDRDRYWIGRLVEAKVPIKKNLFNSVPSRALGLVLKVESNNDRLTYLLVVRWTDGTICPCYQHNIYSYNRGE